MPQRVAVTGIGVICAIGNTREDFAVSLREGRCGIAEINERKAARSEVVHRDDLVIL